MHKLRSRFWVEAFLALLCGMVTVGTLIRPDWIERLFHVEPDAGSGALEWALVGGFLLLTVMFSVMARIEYRFASTGSAG